MLNYVQSLCINKSSRLKTMSHHPSSFRRATRSHPRRGQALIEFAFIAFISVILLGTFFAYALQLLNANILQQAADVAAMEIARLPMPPEMEFPSLDGDHRTSTNPDSTDVPNLFAHFGFKQQIFDEQYLAVPFGDLPSVNANQHIIAEYFADKPLINRMLAPLMFADMQNNVVRYPGAIVTNTDTGNVTVLVPIVTGRNASGVESGIEWRSVVEEIRPTTSTSGSLPFSAGGTVNLRINYPFQAGHLTAHQIELSDGSQTTNPAEILDDPGPLRSIPVLADENGPAFAPPPPYQLVADPVDATVIGGTHTGQYGLGHMFTRREQFTRRDQEPVIPPIIVRPYRRVLTAQAIYRREIFE